MGLALDPMMCPDATCRARGKCPIGRYVEHVPTGERLELACGAAVDKRERPSIETFEPEHRKAVVLTRLEMAALARAEALEQLCAVYRTSSRPTEHLHRELERTRAELDAARAEIELTEPRRRAS